MWRRPIGAGSLRSTHSPTSRRSTSGKSTKECASASRAETRWRTEARGGTGLPATMSPIAIVTGSPSAGCTTQTPSPHARQVPSTSVIAGPPLGPVSTTPGAPSRRTTLRTTTRVPTTCGPRCGAPGGGDAAPEGWASDDSGTTGY